MSDDSVSKNPIKTESFFADGSAHGSEARGRIGVADVVMKHEGENLTARGKALIVGADASLSPDYTGAGVEATLGTIEVDVGNLGGLKLGLSADTEVGVGKKGIAGKLLGTGVKMDGTGSEFTIFGSGVKLGSWSNPWGWVAKDLI